MAYTPEERFTALLKLAQNGGNLSRTSRETGIAKQTLFEWKEADSEGFVQMLLREQRRMILEARSKLLEEIPDYSGSPGMWPQAFATVNKAALLELNKATERSEAELTTKTNEGLSGINLAARKEAAYRLGHFILEDGDIGAETRAVLSKPTGNSDSFKVMGTLEKLFIEEAEGRGELEELLEEFGLEQLPAYNAKKALGAILWHKARIELPSWTQVYLPKEYKGE